ncbi:MAG: hypothetical protein K2O24_05985, partial [Muribaculaceae bacterium]|nr:hypothetical protein [Muribaculaceae bacterium]
MSETTGHTRISLTLAAVGLLTLTASAQQRLDESVAVDGRYKADVVRMERINTFPSPMRFSLTSEPLPYEEKGVAADFAPTLRALSLRRICRG